MRQNVTIALLAVCATLLAVNLTNSIQGQVLRKALGQTAGVQGGNYVIATGITQSGNEAMLYVFDIENKRLAAYFNRGRGIELRGVRNIKWDLNLDWFPGPNSLTPAQVKELWEKSEQAKKAGAGRR